jgi:hypothetical protein
MTLRRVLAISAGAVVFILVFVLFDALSSAIFPTPSGFDPNDPDAVLAHLANTPPAALAVTLLGATVAAFAGAYATATLIGAAGAMWGVVTGAVGLIATMAHALTNQHPLWFIAAAPIGIAAGSALAVWFNMRRKPVRKIRTTPPRKAA